MSLYFLSPSSGFLWNIFMCINICLNECLYTNVCLVPIDTWMPSDPLEVELWMVLSCHVCTRTQTRLFCGSNRCPNDKATAPDPLPSKCGWWPDSAKHKLFVLEDLISPMWNSTYISVRIHATFGFYVFFLLYIFLSYNCDVFHKLFEKLKLNTICYSSKHTINPLVSFLSGSVLVNVGWQNFPFVLVSLGETQTAHH